MYADGLVEASSERFDRLLPASDSVRVASMVEVKCSLTSFRASCSSSVRVGSIARYFVCLVMGLVEMTA